jgi:hypothetical protein
MRTEYERRKSGCGFQLLHDRFIDQAVLPQLWPAVHDATATGDGTLAPSSSFPTRMIAFCWVGMDAVSQVSGLPLRILRIELSVRLANCLRCT